MADKPITRSEEARMFKKQGLPLNTPVEDGRTFSAEYDKHWVRLTRAYFDFMSAVEDYGRSDGSPVKWRQLTRRLDAIRKEMQNCEAFAGKLCGGNVATPIFKSEQAEAEFQVLVFFITERAMPFVEFWEDTIDAVADGKARVIHGDDIPRWFDEEP
jgi:hypothetical protein